MGGLTLGSRTDRRRWFWIGLVMVALAAMAVVVPGASPTHSAKIKNIQYTFVFANSTEDGPGEVVTGLATSNNTTVILADKTELNMHVSCSDRYHLYDTNNNALAKDGTNPDWGWGEKDDPMEGEPGHVRVFDFHIRKDNGSDCGTPIVLGSPAIDIEKTPDLQTLVGAGLVFFTIKVTNVGDVALTDVWVSDDLFGGCAKTTGEVELLKNKGGNDVGPVLSVGENFTYVCFDEILAGFTNEATAYGTWESTEVTDTDDAVVQIVNPAIDIDKTPDLQTLGGPGLVLFTIKVTNIGDVALTDTWVQDDAFTECEQTTGEVELLNNKGGNPVGPILSVGENFTYTCFDEIQAGFTNSATAHGKFGSADVFGTDDAVVTVAHPAITIDKSTDTPNLPVPGLVIFTIKVTNTGDVALTDTWVQDDLFTECELTTGEVELLKNKGGNDVGPILSVGENFTFVCFDEILTGFDNSATAHAMWNATPVQHSDNQLITVGP